MAVMQTYISMLRGINVSGQKPIRMADLKEVYESLRFTHVTTYIQSGNVVFQSKSPDPVTLALTIETAIKTEFGFDVAVILRRMDEIRKVVEKRPSIGAGKADEGRVYVTFLKSIPSPLAVKGIASPASTKGDAFAIKGNVIYLSCPNGYGKTVFSNTFFEKKLKVTATTRNWKTVQALLALAEEIEQSV
jgi:uncharacterized protein (DUF1697 family)